MDSPFLANGYLQVDHGNDSRAHATSPDKDRKPNDSQLVIIQLHRAKSLEWPAEAKHTQPMTRYESQPRDQFTDFASTASMDPSPASCTSDPCPSVSNEVNHGSTDTAIQVSAQDTSIANRERSETTNRSGVLSHSPKSGRGTLRNENTHLQGASGDSKRAGSCELEKSNRKRSTSARLSCPPSPLVVIPDLSLRFIAGKV